MADDFPFARDFGYLMPFLDKVAKAAASLPDPPARAEATRLASEEKVRWERLKQLLAGAPGSEAGSKPNGTPAKSNGRPSATPPPVVPPRRQELPPAPLHLTVGSLRGPKR